MSVYIVKSLNDQLLEHREVSDNLTKILSIYGHLQFPFKILSLPPKHSKTFHPDYTNSETLNTLTCGNLFKHLPIAVSGMAKTVFSVATRKCPWTETPTPYAGKGYSYKITGKDNHNHNPM